ncbi:hypothetical protein ACOMHN_049683 [Nucella lapillus]
MGSASRFTWLQLKKSRAGVSRVLVQETLSKSQRYHESHARFKNKVPLKPVMSSDVNKRWQIDLIDMQGDAVLFGGKQQRYIFSIMDTFSRFVILRPLSRKTSACVARTLKRVFAEHGYPKIVQCDQGGEFKGEVDKLLQRRGIKVIRSRAYHLQSQGKCERSHREVRNKIQFKLKERKGFNWARNLFEIQEAVNNVPKLPLGDRSPAEVYANRGNPLLREEIRKASKHFNQRTMKRMSRKFTTAVYHKAERVLIRYPARGGSKLVPQRSFTCRGVITDRKLKNHMYEVVFRRPDGKKVLQWMSVSDITS